MRKSKTTTKAEFRYDTYLNNMIGGMASYFAEQLGLSSPDPIEQLGVGYSPLEQCWIIPERDTNGDVIGGIRRRDGIEIPGYNPHKMSIQGGSRGLTYIPNPDFSQDEVRRYSGSKHKRIRVTQDRPCPICGKPDWCVIVENNKGEEISVICGRVDAGAIREIDGAGHLHLLKAEGDFSFSGSPVSAAQADTLFIVEGFPDWAILTDRQFAAVARPSAVTRLAKTLVLLLERLPYETIVVVGDNDAAGKSGAYQLRQQLKSFESLKEKSLKVLFPPDEFKDVREWFVKADVTKQQFTEYAEQKAEAELPEDKVDSVSPADIADRMYLRCIRNGQPSIRYYKGSWYEYNGSKYERIGDNQLADNKETMRHRLYEITNDLSYIPEAVGSKETPVRQKMTIGLANNTLDYFGSQVAVPTAAPHWLVPGDKPNPHRVWSFRNGIFDIDKYLQTGEVSMLEPTAELFNLYSFDFDLNLDAPSPLTDDKVWRILNEDQECWDLWWEWVAYNTLTDNSKETFMLMVGKSGYGKGTLLDVLTAIVGHDQMVSTSFKSMCGDFGLHPLVDKLSIQLRDASLGDRNKDAITAMENIKCITGNDPLNVNRKNLVHIPNEKINGKFTFTVNTLPKLPDYARALERRLLLLHFVRDFTEVRDPMLKTKLIQEVPGMMKYVLEGLRRLHTKKWFTEPAASEYMRSQFKNITSPMESFLEEVCDPSGPAQKVEDAQLFSAWLMWCEEENRKYSGNRDEFRANILSLSSKVYKNIKSTVSTVQGRTSRYYTKLKFKEHWHDKLRGQE
jgi:putative DNA primase/helicase